MGRAVRLPGARLLLCLALLFLGACQSAPEEKLALDGERAVFEFEDFDTEDAVYAIDVYDPFEPVNRSIYKFNAVFDRALFIPITELYDFVIPPFVQRRVTSFFSNLTEITTFVNSILQAKFERASRALVRFFVNTTLGLAGLFDVMTELGEPQQREDFGQTLGVWGLGDGPYIVLPIFGPSNLRDSTGLVTDTAAFILADPFGLATFQSNHPEITATQAVERRHGEEFRYFESGSPFEYDFVRLFYTEKRRLDIAK